MEQTNNEAQASSQIEGSTANRRTKVIVATTVMLSFISFWRAAAIVLNDLGSSAYYVGGIAEKAVGRGTGARALKSIIEEVLLNTMFEIPSRPDIKRCIIRPDAIRDHGEPEFEYADEGDGTAIVGESA